LNDLREYILLESSVPENEIRDLDECVLNAESLSDYFDKNSEKIEKIHIWQDGNLEISGWDLNGSLYETIEV
jgi:hypothetical protein